MIGLRWKVGNGSETKVRGKSGLMFRMNLRFLRINFLLITFLFWVKLTP